MTVPEAPPATGLGRSVALTTVALTAGRVVALAAGIVTVVLASRHLGLREFGALNAGMAFASLFAVLTDLGLSTVATREISRNPSREAEVLGHVLGVGAVLALIAAAIGLGAMTLVYGGAADEPTRVAIVILLSQILVTPITGASRAFLTARSRGYLIAVGDMTLAITMAAFTAAVVIGDGSYRLIVAAVAGGYVAQAVVMAAVATCSGARARPARAGALRLVRSALPLAGTLLINYLYFRLDILLLSWLRTDVAVARYALAYRVLEGLMVLPSYVMLALFPTIARQEHDRDALAATVGIALAGLEAAALPVAALMAIFSPEIVTLLGGHRYAAAAPTLAILALALAISYVNGAYGNALMALGRQRTLFWLSVLPLSVNLVANLVLIPLLGITGAAIAVAVSELVALGMIRTYYVRVAGPPRSPRHARILAAGLPLAAIAAVKFALHIDEDRLLVIVVGGTLGVLLYAGALLWLRALPQAIVDQIPMLDRFTPSSPRR